MIQLNHLTRIERSVEAFHSSCHKNTGFYVKKCYILPTDIEHFDWGLAKCPRFFRLSFIARSDIHGKNSYSPFRSSVVVVVVVVLVVGMILA